MKTLIFLLISLQCAAQTLTFHEGAGTNPRHIESIGPEIGWVRLTVGPMAQKGTVLNIDFDDYENIQSVSAWFFDFGVLVRTFDTWGKNTPGIRLDTKKPYETGQDVFLWYEVKLKKV